MEKTSSELDDSWGSGLPCDLARCIGDRLDDLARIYFRAVCRSWRAALPVRRVTSITSPLVFIPATRNRSLSLPLVRCVADSTALALHIAVDSELRCRCVGSSGGWLAVADSDSVIRLVNALTLQVAACLPPLPRPWDSISSTLKFPVRDLGHTIHKVAFSVNPRGSSYGHSAAALHRATRRGQGLALAFTRAGWDGWMWRQPKNYLPFGDDGYFDVAYCQRSGVYYVLIDLLVWVLDMSGPVPTLDPLVRCHESLRFHTFLERRHLVVLSDDGDGGLALSKQMYLVVITDEREQQQNQRVIVHEYTAESWWGVYHLRGRALLISRRAQSVLVLPTAASPPWLRPDCVYWMTGHERTDVYETGHGMSPVWRFHVPTKTTERFVRRQEQLGADYWTLDWHNSLWLEPSLT